MSKLIEKCIEILERNGYLVEHPVTKEDELEIQRYLDEFEASNEHFPDELFTTKSEREDGLIFAKKGRTVLVCAANLSMFAEAVKFATNGDVVVFNNDENSEGFIRNVIPIEDLTMKLKPMEFPENRNHFPSPDKIPVPKTYRKRFKGDR